MSYPIATLPIFLKIKGGWINPAAILWAETNKRNEDMLDIGLVGKEKTLYLNERDSAYVRAFIEENTWEEEDDLEEEEDAI